jgi:ribonuclease HI
VWASSKFSRRKEKQRQEATKKDGFVAFDPSMTIKTSLAECFRVFVDNEQADEMAHRLHRPTRGANLDSEHTTVYTDGSCLGNGTSQARCGAGVWYGHDNPRNRALRVPGRLQSNQLGELAAVVAVLRDTPPFAPLTIITDSEYVKKGFTERLQAWENKGYIGVAHKEWFKVGAYLLQRRSAQTEFHWTKGHEGNEGNEGADALARRGAEKDVHDEFDLEIPSGFDVQGAKMEDLTQRTAYRGIRERKESEVDQRPRTAENILMATEATEDERFVPQDAESVWKGMRSKTIRTNVSDYLFRITHGTYMIGRKWMDTKWPERAICPECPDKIETMEHILFECDTARRGELWALAETVWNGNEYEWPQVSIGTVMASGALSYVPKQRQNTPPTLGEKAAAAGASRLLQILISETAHLIWALRCASVISDKKLTAEAAKRVWWSKINTRLRLDRAVALNADKSRKAIKRLKRTWAPLVVKYGGCNSTTYNEKWLESSGFFSGYQLVAPHSSYS